VPWRYVTELRRPGCPFCDRARAIAPLRGGGDAAQYLTASEPAIAPLYKGGARGDEPLALGSDKKLSGLQSWHPVSPL